MVYIFKLEICISVMVKEGVTMNNSEIFYGELKLIRDTQLSAVVKRMLDEVVPEYFYVVASSSTGKYHPWYAQGYGGLVRHTKAAVKIAYDLLQLEQYRRLDSDAIIAALILHDSFKRGKVCSQYTVSEHPLIAADVISKWAKDNLPDDMQPRFNTICELIVSHSGQWNEVMHKPVLPKPITPDQQFVHLCDYLASRRYIIVEVE